MSSAYCIKCKQKREMINTTLAHASNGTPMEKGECNICGARTSRFLKRIEVQKTEGTENAEKTETTQS